MATIGIFFGSSTGATELIATKLQAILGAENAEIYNVDEATIDDINKYDYLIFGTPTWGMGDLQDDWGVFLEELLKADLSKKNIALFGLGDQDTYPESFVDGMGVMFDVLKDKTTIVGHWPVKGYFFEDSLAVRDQKFVGLPIDEEYQADLTDERLIKWVAILKKEFKIQ
ncbi:MAG: flavodoxin [Bacteroidota bacterium]|nr:flavodoxin [Bacteroidota bacterium]